MKTRFAPLAGALCLSCPLFSCGGGGDDADAGLVSFADAAAPDAVTIDAAPTACDKFEDPVATIASYPGTAAGSLGTGADLNVGPGDCTAEDAPFGVDAPGPEAIVALTGLTPGESYVVRLTSPADLGFYLATGCTGAVGLAPGECLLFVDAQTDRPEVGVLVAPAGGTAYVVVDFYMQQAPLDSSFALEVEPAECNENADCTDPARPYCLSATCAECRNDFDCENPAAPICDSATAACAVGYSVCAGDDPTPPEDGDDGPAGAIDLTPALGATKAATALICNDPPRESDYYKVTVATAGESYTFSLDWTDAAADLDLAVVDSAGRLLGLSYWEKPEPIKITFLPAGTYYAVVSRYSMMPIAAATGYTLAATRDAGTPCIGVADCAAEYRNQAFRGTCVAGGCQFLDGAMAVAPGGLCDSNDDCSADASLCVGFLFSADADTHSFCSPDCSDDNECVAALGAGHVCVLTLAGGFCTRPCTMDPHCPVSFNMDPTAGPWVYTTCNTTTGKCDL
jgi:hypothetical protein